MVFSGMEFDKNDLDNDGAGNIWFHPFTIFNGSKYTTKSDVYYIIQFKCPTCLTFH